MFELSDDAEAALAYLVRHLPDCPSFEDDVLVQGTLELRTNGMAEATTDANQSAIFICSLLAPGRAVFSEHQRMRRGFVSLSDSAEELMLWTYADYARQKRAGGEVNLEEVANRVEDYRELGRSGLLDITWADDRPYFIGGITEKGISYARGDGYRKDAMQTTINNSPVFNINANGGNAASTASSSADASADVSLTASFDGLIDAIRKSDLDFEKQAVVERAVRDIDTAGKKKDVKGLLESLEKASSIAKNVASIGGPLVTFLGKVAGTF